MITMRNTTRTILDLTQNIQGVGGNVRKRVPSSNRRSMTGRDSPVKSMSVRETEEVCLKF